MLDVTVHIDPNGTVQHLWYVKSANKGIKLHASSHVPASIKANTIRNEFARATSLSSDESNKNASTLQMTQLFERNGYSKELQQRMLRRNLSYRRVTAQPTQSSTLFQLPFISDNFTQRIRRAFQAVDLNVTINIQPGKQLRNLLKRPNYPYECKKRNCPINDNKNCFRHNVVYRVTCDICQQFYIGSTIRHFHERAIEHYRAANNPPSYKNYALATHYHELHHFISPKLSFRILNQCKSELDTIISEASHIHKDNPPMNIRHERDMVYATRLLV